jgi:hypothetical protein
MAMMGYEDDAIRISERWLRREGDAAVSSTIQRRVLAAWRIWSRALLGDEYWRKWVMGEAADGGAATVAMSGRKHWKWRRIGEEWLWER